MKGAAEDGMKHSPVVACLFDFSCSVFGHFVLDKLLARQVFRCPMGARLLKNALKIRQAFKKFYAGISLRPLI